MVALISATALLFYDYILTLRHEVRFVWGRRFSAATALFLVNRYFIILLYLVDVVTLFPILAKASPLLSCVRFCADTCCADVRGNSLMGKT